MNEALNPSPGASGRTITVEALPRVEGEGGLYARLEDGRVTDLQLNIFEPPRFFEAFLCGRHFQEVPDITARICGICPVAYQMSAVHALEAALGIAIDPEIRLLRRLLYCAEWMESHALHIYLLQAPDFLKYESALSLAADHPAVVERGLRLKKAGNALLAFLGGRSVHPVSVCVGGFYKVPRRNDLLRFREELEWGLEAAVETARFVAALPFPDFAPGYEFVALSHPGEYPFNEGRIISSRGMDIPAAEFESVFLEEHVAHSNALHSVRVEQGTQAGGLGGSPPGRQGLVPGQGGSSYLVGPLARVNLNLERLLPRARQAAAASGIAFPSQNPFHGIVARAVELVQAFEEALQLLDAYREPARSRVEVRAARGEGCAATEAPRGTLYHRYRLDEQGLVELAKIVPPTAQNMRRIEDDLRALIERIAQQPDAEIARACENLVRCYDPCISCSVHFLKLRLERGPVHHRGTENTEVHREPSTQRRRGRKETQHG
jgi:coenzyme F420-reducing hydrogenase alpha subunit